MLLYINHQATLRCASTDPCVTEPGQSPSSTMVWLLTPEIPLLLASSG